MAGPVAWRIGLGLVSDPPQRGLALGGFGFVLDTSGADTPDGAARCRLALGRGSKVGGRIVDLAVFGKHVQSVPSQRM
jgi:hypothetical protein